MSKKAIFLDRDGVINKEVNYLFKIEDFEFIEGIFDTCLYFQNLGYAIIIVTNQSGIARKYYTENDYQTVTKWMLRQFEDNGCIQIYQEEFLKSEGLKKLLESHTIYRDTERKIKAEVKDSTIKRWLREANLKPQSDEENK